MRRWLSVLLPAIVAASALAAPSAKSPKRDYDALHPAFRVSPKQLRAWVAEGVALADAGGGEEVITRRWMRSGYPVRLRQTGVSVGVWAHWLDGYRIVLNACQAALYHQQRGLPESDYPAGDVFADPQEFAVLLAGEKTTPTTALRLVRAELRDDRGGRWPASFVKESGDRRSSRYLVTIPLFDGDGKARVTRAAGAISLHAWTADGSEFRVTYRLQKDGSPPPEYGAPVG
jgi:hypothetical protein